MEKVRPHTLSGFMELLPAPQAQMERMHGDPAQNLLSLRLHTFGHPCAAKPADVLLAKGGGETEKQIYRFHEGRQRIWRCALT